MGRALITGASSGLGSEFAAELAERGHDLVLVARRRDRLVELATRLHRETNAHVEVIVADLSVREEVEKVAVRLGETNRPVDLLVNNAGFGMRSSVAGDLAEHERAVALMVNAVLVLSHAAAVSMRERGHGGILNVSSVAGHTAMGNYAAIKSWVTVFSEALSNELAGTGVRVTALCPGLVRTEFHEYAKTDLPGTPDFAWLDARRVVRAALADLDRGRVISVPTPLYWAGTVLLRHLPRRAIRAGSSGLIRFRRKRH